jgi:hypothetical protein
MKSYGAGGGIIDGNGNRLGRTMEALEEAKRILRVKHGILSHKTNRQSNAVNFR